MTHNIDGLVQDCSISSVLAMEILLSYIKSSISGVLICWYNMVQYNTIFQNEATVEHKSDFTKFLLEQTNPLPSILSWMCNCLFQYSFFDDLIQHHERNRMSIISALWIIVNAYLRYSTYYWFHIIFFNSNKSWLNTKWNRLFLR